MMSNTTNNVLYRILKDQSETLRQIAIATQANCIMLERICQHLDVQEKFKFDKIRDIDEYDSVEERLLEDAVYCKELVRIIRFLRLGFTEVSFFKQKFVYASCKGDIRNMLELLYEKDFLSNECNAVKSGGKVAIKRSIMYNKVIVGE